MPDTVLDKIIHSSHNERISRRDLVNAYRNGSNYMPLDVLKEVQQYTVAHNNQPYGIASKADFGLLSQLAAYLFAFDNKHFYVYKSISDPNKIAYLSRKQYYKLSLLCKKLGISIEDRNYECITRYLESYGTHTTPLVFLKNAFKENKERTKFLLSLFPLNKETGNCADQGILEGLMNNFLKAAFNLKIIDADIQECYDVDLRDSFSGSGTRYVTNSCMQHDPVGKFYDNLPVHGKIIMHDDEQVGRFLYWDLPDGKHYVERLYVKKKYAQQALALIDETFKDALKYPYLKDERAKEMYLIPFKSTEPFNEKIMTPWIDTFAFMYEKLDTGECFLSNKCSEDVSSGYRLMAELRSQRSDHSVTKCPKCGCLLHPQDYIRNQKVHFLFCEAYKPHSYMNRELVDIARKQLKELLMYRGGKHDYYESISEIQLPVAPTGQHA